MQLEVTQGNRPSITLHWNHATYTGNEFPIQKYRIVISEINYSEEVEGKCSGSQCSHSITADGSDVRFNTPYLVEVTAVNTCDLESSPANLSVTVLAYGEYYQFIIMKMFKLV